MPARDLPDLAAATREDVERAISRRLLRLAPAADQMDAALSLALEVIDAKEAALEKFRARAAGW